MLASERESAVATLVASDAVDKLSALDAVARAVGAAVVGPATSHPTVPLADDVWVVIEIPKFGEPPPLTIDVHAVAGRAAAQSHALALMETLQQETTWTIITDFERLH
ncbi:hypothetical protein FHX49_001723 [Microbacterium endophyticum]|uniref:Uncharacterized protein n=1 Tax=Microbacterium endophyticum TaxID=1526412 RepID=A0A7W4V3E0_9MICO|nr:hypothetical protein [Microbacterium endophyticum]MBB2976153.1 hypothetical protein [Microbacterium endophyticum]NIK36450.1 hypothetical protein [Microbacterium endophyticum]